jgi:ATP-dependent RNA helicase RhlE
MSFDGLGLAPDLLRSVAREGYTEPTPVQREAIPLVLAGRDVLAGAQTGTGKTAAFVLPMLQQLHASRGPGRPVVRALILAPTRELALQVEASVRTYGSQRPIRSTTIYGGVGFDPQVRALRAGPEIVVATPGRLLDHLGQGTIDLSRVEILVLDEADRMLDMGFIRDIRRILAVLPARRQNLLFSATFSDDIRRLADDFLDQPVSVQVSPRNQATQLVTQVVHPVDRERKRELLSHLIKTGRIDQALVFTRTKHGANRLATQLEHDGILATAIHGNKSQPQRVRALADFKAGRFTVLVATEVAARGIDIDALPHVVNFELPMVPEDYVHRIGRTGRAGVDGDAVSLVCVDELKLLRDIERVLGHSIPSEVIEGFEPDPRIRPEPILRGGLGGARPSGGMRTLGGPRPMRGQPAPAGQYASGMRRGTGAGRPIVGARPAGEGRGPGEQRFASGPGFGGRGRNDGRRPGEAAPANAASRPDRSRQGVFARPNAPTRGTTERPSPAWNGVPVNRRPGQGIGNPPAGRPARGMGSAHSPAQRPAGGPGRHAAARSGHAGRPGPTRVQLPGERLSRFDGARSGG